LNGSARESPAEQAAPHCRDPDRIADPSTIRRWFWRRLESLRFLACAPTPFAWEWRAASPYSDRGANRTMIYPDNDATQRQISLLDYLNNRGGRSLATRDAKRLRALPAASLKTGLRSM